MRISLFTIALTVILYSYSCHSSTKPAVNVQPAVVPPVTLRPVYAGLNESREVSIDSTKSRLPEGKEFLGAQFLNAEKGWVFNDRLLFTTSDAAKSWIRLPLVLSEDSQVSSVFFIDSERGWLASHVRLLVKPYDIGNSSTITFTSDGGRSWSEQVTFREGVEITQLKFFDPNQGLAIGSRFKESSPPHIEIFVAKTTDGGKNWIDISENVKPAVNDGTPFAEGRGRDVYWLSADEILLLLAVPGRIIKTSDSGKTWKGMARFKDERPEDSEFFRTSTHLYKIVFDPQRRLTLIGGTVDPDQGYWGDFVLQEDQSKWLIYELRRIPIFDAVFLSDSELLACGMEVYRPDDRSAARYRGILLHSSDSGKNWTPIYRSNVEESFIHLSKIGDRDFYAVSDAGTVLRFSLKEIVHN